VAVGLSGGVDSAVTALLLKRQGFAVVGVHLYCWPPKSEIEKDGITREEWIKKNGCRADEDRSAALKTALELEIPFKVLDFSDEYNKRVVSYFYAEYEAGRTPNPDVLCNSEIKFGLFMDWVMKNGFDYVATGHYCRKGEIEVNGKKVYQLLSGADDNKDQSYFLCQLSQEQLAKSLFPIGELTKPEVREIAAQMDLVTADKKDSQGLCFIGKVRLPEFLQQKLQAKEGSIIQIDKNFPIYNTEKPVFNSEIEALAFEAKSIDYTPEMGKLVGKHQGAHYFTNGQRKGLGVGGTTEPLFIIATNVKTNTVYTGLGSQHPGLFKKALFIEKSEVHWIREDLALANGETMEVMARIRYRQPLQKATLHQFKNGMYVSFEEPQSAITEGQFVAWYFDDELVGSGVIS